jgi:hypothetical protein
MFRVRGVPAKETVFSEDVQVSRFCLRFFGDTGYFVRVCEAFFGFLFRGPHIQSPVLQLVCVPLIREDVPVPFSVPYVILDYKFFLLGIEPRNHVNGNLPQSGFFASP